MINHESPQTDVIRNIAFGQNLNWYKLEKPFKRMKNKRTLKIKLIYKPEGRRKEEIKKH